MTPSDDLFVLIDSLSKSEKRFFRLYAAKQSSTGVADYLHLFDVLDGMESYDDERLRLLVDERTAAHLSQTKHYLYNAILRALSRFHAGADVEFQIYELLQGARVLYDKRLYDQCRKVLHRAKKLALVNDRGLSVLKILVEEYRLAILESHPTKTDERIDAIFDEMIRLSDQLALRNRYWRVQAKMYRLRTEVGDSRDERIMAKARELLNDPVMADGEAIDDPSAKLFYLFAFDHYYDTVRDDGQTYEYRRKIVEFIESEPVLRGRTADRYIPALHNFCLAAIQARRFDRFHEGFIKLEEAVASLRRERQSFNDLHIRMLVPRMHIERGEFDLAKERIDAMRADLPGLWGGLRRGFGIYFQYLGAYACFGVGDFVGALEWTNAIINRRRVEMHEELHCYGRILDLLVHYELGNLIALDSYLASASRFLVKHGRMREFEELALDLVRRLCLAPDRGRADEILSRALGRLRLLREDEFHRRSFTYIDLFSWVQSKLEGRTFMEVVRRNREAESAGSPASDE